MIAIDRSSPTSVADQLVQQLRYQIAGGRFKTGDVLPSTRSLANQVGVSFHTVRKAYQQLEREGFLTAATGSKYAVQEPVILSKGDRMERGAQIVQLALQQLVSFGLNEAEIESIFHEQLDLLEEAHQSLKLVFGAQSAELADLCARQLSHTLQRDVQGIALKELAQHQDTDFVFAAGNHLRMVLEMTPRAEVRGVAVYLEYDVLERVARLLPHQTLGLITRDADTIPPLIQELRHQASFDGQVMAVSIEDSTLRLGEFVRQVDLLLYTPACRRRLLSSMDEARGHSIIAPVLSRESLDAAKATVPG